jgi:hypothetical protein
MLTTWQKVLREGVFPLISTKGLEALKKGLETDDARLVQDCTTTPPPLAATLGWPCEGACLIGYCGWFGDELATVGEVEEFFARVCFEADQRLGEPAAVRHALNWYDDTDRTTMRRELLAEVNLGLARRNNEVAEYETFTDAATGPETSGDSEAVMDRAYQTEQAWLGRHEP